ncbi:MAG: DNA-3-methyladenine glycosylase [Candidatus Kapabacteria bacterium]|nr:DNA-3-methyladenine glycosylase [Candidatus Kapabacteria bacterium]
MQFIPNFTQSLQKKFYLQDTETVARELLGKILVKFEVDGSILAARIVETEAYLAEKDLASHSAVGRTKRNEPMFAEAGILYVYKIYGIHHCFNIVTEPENRAAAVLIRALEPIVGIEIMKSRRKSDKIYQLCKGPGNSALSLGFDRNYNYRSLCTEQLFIQNNSDAKVTENLIVKSRRIGINRASELELRYFLKDNIYVSGKK